MNNLKCFKMGLIATAMLMLLFRTICDPSRQNEAEVARDSSSEIEENGQVVIFYPIFFFDIFSIFDYSSNTSENLE